MLSRMNRDASTSDAPRIDKWLWAARFFRTRTLAAKAVAAGHVSVNGARVKPSRELRVGERLEIRTEGGVFSVTVLKLSERRGPASEARLLYEESAESIARREAEAEERRIAREAGLEPRRPEGRPDKRSRRKIRQFLQKD